MDSNTGVNIGGDDNDRDYRYKMPPLRTKIEGRGNGIKTVITNMSDVAKALNIPTAYPTKFFGCELGAQSKYDSRGDKAVVNGAHQTLALTQLLTRFIEKFILCRSCRLPELIMNVDARKNTITQTCNACGWSGAPDMNHRLIPFILRNPPENGTSRPKALPETVKGKRSAKKQQQQRDDAKHSSSQPRAASQFDTSADAELQLRKNPEDDAELRQRAAAEEEAQRQRAQQQRDLMQTISVEAFEKYCAENAGASQEQLVFAIRNIATQNGLDAQQRLAVALSLVDRQSSSILQQFQQCITVLANLVEGDDQLQLTLLQFVEKLCFKDNPAVKERFQLLLKFLYDSDALEEDVIMRWFEEDTLSHPEVDPIEAREASAQFLEWLVSAEEEEDEEEEEDDDDDDDEEEEDDDDDDEEEENVQSAAN